MANNKNCRDRILTFILSMLICCVSGYAEMRTDTFSFFFEGKKYSGLLDIPEQKKATAMIVLVSGSGKTDMVAGGGFHDIRSRFTEQGFACLVWDKAGCGKSEGVFNYTQTIFAVVGLTKSNTPNAEVGVFHHGRQLRE